jgi:hypothetical protein
MLHQLDLGSNRLRPNNLVLIMFVKSYVDLCLLCWHSVGVSNPGVPGPTSKLSPRALAQMGRRETEREGGKKPEGDRRER